MNIITNNCLGGYIYRDVLRTQYENPFVWCFIEPYFDFIQDYPNIDFKNYELKRIETDSLKRFKIVINEKYELKFWHYWFDKNATVPVVCDSDVKYNKIWEYVVTKYEERLKRMNTSEQPIFMFYGNELSQKSFEILKKKSLTNKVLVFNNNFSYENTNMKCFPIDEKWKDPKYVVKKYHKEIKDFV